VTQGDHMGGGRGVAYARQGDFDTCYLVFMSVSIGWTCSGYFLTNGTTLHLRIKVKCMHHIEHD